MLKICTAFIICIALASPIQAAGIITFGKEFIVVFTHKGHQENLGGCTECHGTKEPGRIAGFGQTWAHDVCVGCHSENKAGPVECGDCHNQM